MKISNFLRRSLPLLCAALLLASLAVPVAAASAASAVSAVSASGASAVQPADDSVVGTWILNDTISWPTSSCAYSASIPYGYVHFTYNGSSYWINFVALLLEPYGDSAVGVFSGPWPPFVLNSFVDNNVAVCLYSSSDADLVGSTSGCSLLYDPFGKIVSPIDNVSFVLTDQWAASVGDTSYLLTWLNANAKRVPSAVPSVSLSGDTLSISFDHDYMSFSGYRIYVDGEFAVYVPFTEGFTALFSLTDLELSRGGHQITVAGGHQWADFTVRSAPVTYSHVPVPVLSISGDTLTLECSDSTVTQFAIYVNDELKATINRDSVATQYNLAQLELAAGTYQITAAAYAGASTHSEPSAAVSYTASGKIFFTVGSLSFDVDVGTTWQDFVSSTSWPSNGVTLAIGSDNSITYSTDSALYLVSDVVPSDQITAKTYEISLVNELTTFVVSIDGSAYKFTCDTGSQWAEWIRDTTFPVNGCTFALDGDLVRVTKDGKTLLVSGVTGNDVIDAKTYTAGQFSLTAGSWSAHSSLTAWPSDLDTVSLAFASAGQSYASMSSSIYLPSGGNCLYYGDLPVYGYGPLEKDTGWKASQYSSIYFASAQAVSYDFYTWFTANFDYVGADPIVQEVKTTINIYDQTGNVLLDTITFTGSGSAPEVSFSVGFDGCVFSSNGSDVPWSFVYADYSFMGFSVNNASGDPAYVPDESYTLPGGAGVDTVWSLYVVQTTQKLYRFNFYDTSFRLCDSFYFYADGAVTVTLMPLPVEDPNGGLTYVKFAVFYNDTNHVVEVGNFVSVWDLIDGRLYQTCCDLKTGAGPMQATKALGNAGGVFSLYFSVSAHDCLDLNGNYPDGFTAEGIIAPDPPPDDDSSGSSAGAAFAGFGNFAMDVIRGLLDFEFAPGLSLGSIVEFFVYIALFLLFLKLTS